MKSLSFTKKLLISYVALVVTVFGLSLALVLPRQIEVMNQHLEGTLSRVSYILAFDREIISAMEAGEISPSLRARIDGISSITKDLVDYIVIADRNSTRLYHPDAALVGKKFVGGDEADALNGVADEYFTTAHGLPDVQKRAFHSIRDDNGNIIGFVMVSTSTRSIEIHKSEILIRTGGFLIASLAAGLFLAFGITTNVKRILLGYDPTTFARMYLQREEILDKLHEGIFVVNQNRRIIYTNSSANLYLPDEMLSTRTLPKHSPLFPGVFECLMSNTEMTWSSMELAEKPLLVSMVALRSMENLDAVMVILRDRTEFVKLMEQLTGTNHVVEALRANTHEFRNKIHTILGLLQLNYIDEAMNYINVEWAKSSGQNVLRLIKDKVIAGLLMGKANRAEELNIELAVRSDSYLPEENNFLTAKEMTLIIGNLIENAYEAIGDSDGDRQVEVFIKSDDQGLTITVDDTGCGMTDEQIDRIVGGSSYTTKGVGHGNGMKRIREVVERHHGYLQIESEPGAGTAITVNIHV